MHRVLFAVSLSAVLAACGSSVSNTNDTSTPVAACQSLAGLLCNRFFACDSAAADIAFGNATNCTTQAEARASCSTQACPTGTTYSSTQAQACLNDVNALPCTDFLTGTPTQPASCNTVCQ